MQPELVLVPLRRHGETLQHLQPFREVTDGLDVGRAGDRVLAGPLPVGQGLFEAAGQGVMVGQEFGLVCARRRKAVLEEYITPRKGEAAKAAK